MGSKKMRKHDTGKCLDCGGMLEIERRPYRYRFEGGLSVTLENATILRCVLCAAESVAIHAPARLHRAVAAAIVRKPSRLTSSEVAFLRHHLDMTGVEMAQHLGVTKTSVSRWETEREPIGQVPDRLLRTLVLLRDSEVRPDLGLFARLGTVAKPSRIKVVLQGTTSRRRSRFPTVLDADLNQVSGTFLPSDQLFGLGGEEGTEFGISAASRGAPW